MRSDVALESRVGELEQNKGIAHWPIEDQFRLLVESVVDYAIFLLDSKGYIVTWNKGAARLKGYTASEIIGNHFSIFYPPEEVERGHPQEELAIAEAEGRYEEEGWRVRKDGSRFWANVVITALRDPEGNLCGFGKVTRDFTARRAAEQARERVIRDEVSRVFLREILYSVTEGRLRFCEAESELPKRLPALVGETSFSPRSLKGFRKDVIRSAESVGFERQRIVDLLTASSEAAMNAVVHATHGCYAVCATESVMQVWIMDHGSGIELNKLHRATLERGYTTESSLGHGFWLMLQTCDRIWLRSGPDGTTVVLEQEASAPQPEWLRRPRELSDYVQAGSSGD